MSKKPDYTREEVLKLFFEGSKTKRPYQVDIVARTGPLSRKKPPYSEIIASLVLEDESIGVVPYVENVKDDFAYSDKRDLTLPSDSEKGLCRHWFFNRSFADETLSNVLGIPAEYEINIVPQRGGHTNVDLISYNCKTKTAYFIEVKGGGGTFSSTKESLLRAVLEIKTYYESLKSRFCKITATCRDKNQTGIRNAENLKMAILLPVGSIAALEFNNPRFPSVNKLIQNWGIEVFAFDPQIQRDGMAS